MTPLDDTCIPGIEEEPEKVYGAVPPVPVNVKE